MSAWKLPEEWVDTQLGNIVNYGKATKRVLADVNDDTWVLELEDIEKESSKLLSTIRASERPFKSTKNSFKKGDVLYGKLRPYLNKIIIAEEDGVCTTEIIPINAEPSCCNKYIFYWLKSSTFLGYVNDVSYGVNMPRLGTADGLKAPLRLAPLAEQKIIAEKLDTLLAQVDSTKARLERIPQILKRFRQAVLAFATSGKLTETWRQNNNLCHPKEIIIDNIVESSFYGPRFSKNDYTFETNGIPTIRTTDMERGNIIITDGTPRVCVPIEKIEQLKVQKNDLLITRTGSIGVMALFTENYLAIPSAYLIRFRFKKNINSKYIYLCLAAPKGQQQMGLSATAITQSNINAKSIRNINICYPDIAEQAEIVRRVEQLFAYADTIEKQVNSALTRVNSLTQSILAKAFRGELTAQWRAGNPDLISGENSAAALLEKIKAERAASGGKKTSRKKA